MEETNTTTPNNEIAPITIEVENVEDKATLEMLSTDDEMDGELVLFPKNEELSYPTENLKLELDYMDEKLQEDKLWRARTGLNDETICGAIETILFMSDKPVSLSKIKALIDEDMPLRVVHESIARLQKEYESKHHGIRLQEVAHGFQFRTKATYAKYVQDLFKVNELVLSPTALEVLAILAYKQPVSKVEVEKIRGVDSSHIVRGLMDKRLVKVVGRSEEVGKPVLYGTTEEFLEVFNLANLDQLPPQHELQEIATQSVGKIADITGLINSDLKTRFSSDELSELDELSNSIKTIEAETDFIKSLKVEEKKRTKGESGEAIKTAFDLLEEFLDKTLVSKQNKNSVLSEVFTAITDPQVINDLEAGPFNIPEMEDDEEFEMLDLDSGEVIEAYSDSEIELEMEDDSLEVDFALDSNEEVEDKPVQAQEEVEIVDIMANPNNEEDEAGMLAKALDDAFSKLLGGSSMLSDDEELSEEDISGEIDAKTSKMIDAAREFDIDLSFMKNNNLDNGNDELS